jgi:predicted aconitase
MARVPRAAAGADAALTARTPGYGYHLEERRRATLVVNVGFTPRELNQWRALGGTEGFPVEEIAARKAMTMRDRPLQRRSRRSDS